MKFCIVYLSLLFLQSSSHLTRNPIVEITTGKIEGYLGKAVNGRTYFAFDGIPFAQPPVGENRFEEPKPVEPWKDTWIANTTIKCIQYNQYTEPGQEFVIGNEDCLYLSVYTPTLDQNAGLDVIVYIHGGAFMFTHGGLQGPQMLLQSDVVYVKFNYRLGPLGFLSTEDDVVPGNNGLKDQMMALKWIQDNVGHFGGNSSSITITGMSAGGASVHMHYLAPRSRGLFHKGHSQSGCALNPWALMEAPLEKARQLAALVGCTGTDIAASVACMKGRPAKQLVNAVQYFQPWLYNPFSPFGATVDAWAADPVLPDHPHKLLKAGKVADLPWIASFTESEGLYPVSDFYTDAHLADVDARWNELVPFMLDYNYTVPKDKQNVVSQKIRQFYLKNNTVSKETYMDLVGLASDRLFLNGIQQAVLMQAKVNKSPVYCYRFSYRGAHSFSEITTKSSQNFGASHGDDTAYLLKMDVDTQTAEEDRQMSKVVIEMETSFARTGVPHIRMAKGEWTPQSTNSSELIDVLFINSPNDINMCPAMSISKAFWKTLQISENEKFEFYLK